MPEPVKADDVLHLYMALALNGTPTMGEGASPLDGKTVRHTSGEDYTGVVVGPAPVADFVWVSWGTGSGEPHHGLHRLTDLKEVT